MRTILNKTFKDLKRMQIQINPEKPNESIIVETMMKSSYFKILHDIVNNPPAKGWNSSNAEALRCRISLKNKFSDNKKKNIKIEELEYMTLIEAMPDYGLYITSEEILDFIDYIKNLPQEKL